MRRVGMQASPNLFTTHRGWERAMKTRIRLLLMAIGALIVMTVMQAQSAKADAPYCTPYNPSPPYQGVCTGGYGNYCTLGLACSPVPGTPGTLNPDGYTPICNNSGGCSWS